MRIDNELENNELEDNDTCNYRPQLNDDISMTYPTSLDIEAKDFCEIFPYHVMFDKNMKVTQCGSQLQVIATGTALYINNY